MPRQQRRQEKEQKAFEALPFHKRQSKTRQKNRAEKRKIKEWSPDRPQRPEYDDLYLQIASEFSKLNGTAWALANKSGLSTSTVYAMRHRSRKTGLGTTLQMAAKAAGGRLVFIKDH